MISFQTSHQTPRIEPPVPPPLSHNCPSPLPPAPGQHPCLRLFNGFRLLSLSAKSAHKEGKLSQSSTDRTKAFLFVHKSQTAAQWLFYRRSFLPRPPSLQFDGDKKCYYALKLSMKLWEQINWPSKNLLQMFGDLTIMWFSHQLASQAWKDGMWQLCHVRIFMGLRW